MPEFIIFLSMDIFNKEFDDFDNKLCNFLLFFFKENFLNIMDYYLDCINENSEKEDAFNVDFEWV